VTLSSHNVSTERARELIKPSKDAESFLVLICKNWDVVDLIFFVGDVILGVSLGFFGLHLNY